MTEQGSGIGFVGLGVMGEAMCLNLKKRSGRRVLGFDRSLPAAEHARAHGIEICDSLADVTQSAEIVFLCLPNSNAVANVCEAIVRSPGNVRIVVDCSTTSLDTTRFLVEAMSRASICFADAPISRMRKAAIDGTLLFLVGASQELFHTIRPLLSCMGTDILMCGPAGSGQVVKILNNMVLISHVHSLAAALATARAHGVSGDILFDAFSEGSADSQAVRNQGVNHLLTDNFPIGTFSTIYARKDIGLAQELFKAAAIDTRQLDATADMLDLAAKSGLAEVYYPAFLKILSSAGTPTGEQAISR